MAFTIEKKKINMPVHSRVFLASWSTIREKENKQTKKPRNLLSLPPLPDGGGHWGGSEHRNTAKKKSQNTAILQYRVENVIPRPLLCMLKFRANKTEITTKNLLMNVRSGNFWFKQSQ